MAEFGAARNAHLGGQGAAFAGDHPMADLHQVVDFGASANPGFAHRWAIDGGAAAHLHRLFQHHKARLGHFSPSLGRGNKAKTLAAHHRVGMHHALGGQTTAGVEHGPGMDFASFGQLYVRVENGSGMEGAAVGDGAGLAHHHMGANVHTGADGGAGIHHRSGMNPRWFGLARVQAVEGFGKGEPGILEGNPSQPLGGGDLLQVGIWWQQHRRCPCVSKGQGQGIAPL